MILQEVTEETENEEMMQNPSFTRKVNELIQRDREIADAQRAEAHVRRFVIIGKGKSVIRLQPAEIGQCLLERRAHSVHLTPVGEGFLREARELLQHADQVLERVRTAGRGVRLRVGYAPALASGILSAAVGNFTQAHPDAKVALFDLSTGEMLAELESNGPGRSRCCGPHRATLPQPRPVQKPIARTETIVHRGCLSDGPGRSPAVCCVR